MSNPVSKARNTNNIKSLYTLKDMNIHERQSHFCGQNANHFNVKVRVRAVVRWNGERSHCRYSVHVCTFIYYCVTVCWAEGEGEGGENGI